MIVFESYKLCNEIIVNILFMNNNLTAIIILKSKTRLFYNKIDFPYIDTHNLITHHKGSLS